MFSKTIVTIFGNVGYMYSQYCKLYQDYVDQNKLTMHIQHKPGDKIMVDWAIWKELHIAQYEKLH